MANPLEFSVLEADPEEARPTKVSWNSGLCDFCNDPAICCFGLWCPPCLYGRNYAKLHDVGCCGACCLYLWCPCMACYFASDSRRRLREKYNLLPEPCNDFLVHCCCSPCGLCQEAREARFYESAPAPAVAEPL